MRKCKQSKTAPIPDFIFIDIDKIENVNADTALYKTLKDIKEKFDI